MLRSIKQLYGDKLGAADGEIGHVPNKVDRISYEESTVFVNLTGAAVEQSPAHHLAAVGAAD